MRDPIFVAYSITWIVLAWSVKRVPFWQPRVVRFGDAAFVPDQRPAGCMMLLFLVMGAAIGMALPMAVSDVLPRDPTQFHTGGASGLDGFGRLAMLVGGLCGGYVGLRGSRLGPSCFLRGVPYTSPPRSWNGCSAASDRRRRKS